MIDTPVRYGYFGMVLLVIALLLGQSADAVPIFGKVKVDARILDNSKAPIKQKNIGSFNEFFYQSQCHLLGIGRRGNGC